MAIIKLSVNLQSYHNHQMILRCVKLSLNTATCTPFKINFSTVVNYVQVGALIMSTNWFFKIRIPW